MSKHDKEFTLVWQDREIKFDILNMLVMVFICSKIPLYSINESCSVQMQVTPNFEVVKMFWIYWTTLKTPKEIQEIMADYYLQTYESFGIHWRT